MRRKRKFLGWSQIRSESWGVSRRLLSSSTDYFLLHLHSSHLLLHLLSFFSYNCPLFSFLLFLCFNYSHGILFFPLLRSSPPFADLIRTTVGKLDFDYFVLESLSYDTHKKLIFDMRWGREFLYMRGRRKGGYFPWVAHTWCVKIEYIMLLIVVIAVFHDKNSYCCSTMRRTIKYYIESQEGERENWCDLWWNKRVVSMNKINDQTWGWGVFVVLLLILWFSRWILEDIPPPPFYSKIRFVSISFLSFGWCSILKSSIGWLWSWNNNTWDLNCFLLTFITARVGCWVDREKWEKREREKNEWTHFLVLY